MCLRPGCTDPRHTPSAHAPTLDRRAILVTLVGAAGSLTVGCTPQQLGSLNLVSTDEVNQMGAVTWQRTLKETRVSRDPAANAMVKRVSEKIVAASRSPVETWEYAVLEDETPNAFALPGGKIGVHTGILRLMQNDDQLATVIGHEVGHVNLGHGQQRVNAQAASQIGLTVLNIAMAAGNVGYANEISGLLGAGVNYGVILPFSRDHEYEADQVGVTYMADAGYDPMQAVAFWQAMARASSGGQKPPEWASTHPSDENRIERIRALATLERNRVRRG
jgi:predicted Zn-dependent protease